MTMTARELAQTIDHTLLAPEATAVDVARLVDEGVRLGVYSVCVSPSMLPLDAKGLKKAVVCGFPSGAHASAAKAAEARLAAVNGADEVDMVMNLGLAAAGDWAGVAADIKAVRDAAPGVVLKVIIESALWSDDQIVQACQAAERAGAQFVKTSTGFHKAGGASVHAVELMKATVGDRLQVKASGGIRTLAQAQAMLAAGATRLGMSSGAAVLAELAGAADGQAR